MKKIIVIALFMSCFICSLFSQRVNTIANLNLRVGPSTDFTSLGLIPKGEDVEVLSISTNEAKWLMVKYGSHIGFVCSKYLKFSNTSTLLDSYPRKEISLPTSSVHYYTNVNGNRVQAPTYYTSRPSNASAVCYDGTYSFSQNARGTCSRHGGVKQWLR